MDSSRKKGNYIGSAKYDSEKKTLEILINIQSQEDVQSSLRITATQGSSLKYANVLWASNGKVFEKDTKSKSKPLRTIRLTFDPGLENIKEHTSGKVAVTHDNGSIKLDVRGDGTVPGRFFQGRQILHSTLSSLLFNPNDYGLRRINMGRFFLIPEAEEISSPPQYSTKGLTAHNFKKVVAGMSILLRYPSEKIRYDNLLKSCENKKFVNQPAFSASAEFYEGSPVYYSQEPSPPWHCKSLQPRHSYQGFDYDRDGSGGNAGVSY